MNDYGNNDYGYYEPLQHVVQPEEDGWMLKTILQKRMSISRKLLSRLKLSDRGITVNGVRQYISMRVKAGDRVELRMQRESSQDILPQPIPLHIMHEDEHLLVICKEAGMIVHPTHGHYVNTVANGVMYYWKQRGEERRFRPVHRLDQETSGVLVIAKNPYAHQWISAQMQAREVRKDYIAIVHGAKLPASGTVDAPIARSSQNPHIRVVSEGGDLSATLFQVEQTYRSATRVRLWPKTGRTHQLRVHLHHLGHPIIGDKLYRPETETAENLELDEQIGRHALHAAQIAFFHPGTKRWTEFAAELPQDMRQLIALLDKLK